METQIYLVFILLTIPAVFSEDHRYCSLPSCPNRTHTLCKYPNPGPVSRCAYVLQRGLTMDQKRFIINVYNRNRPSASLYDEDDILEPHPSSVTIDFRIYWDNELEIIAQRWADQCINADDECRDTDRFFVRQRVYLESLPGIDDPSLHPIISRWYREDRSPILSNLNFSGLSIEQAVFSASNHYTHLMRQIENRMGCGAIKAFDERFNYLYLVCNYGIHVSSLE